MRSLKEAMQDHLVLRRSPGFKLKKHSRFLKEFALFLEQEGASRITSRLALQWATEPQYIQQAEWAARLSVVRGFARYWSATDPLTEIPPDGLLPYRPAPPNPTSIPMSRSSSFSRPPKICPLHTACSPGLITVCSGFWR
jgi:integrase/recombinase XerD